MIKVGLIGLGAMGGTHATAYNQLKGEVDFKVTAFRLGKIGGIYRKGKGKPQIKTLTITI